MRHDNSYRRAKRLAVKTAMTRNATMNRIADLEVKVAVMEYQAGMKDSLKGLFLKYIAEPLDKYRKHKRLFMMPIDDLMDDVIEAIAPEYAESLMEAEVDADFNEFKAGVELRLKEKSLGGRGGYFPEMNPPKDESDEFIEGYIWGDKNTKIPTSVKKKFIEQAAKKHSKSVVETVLKNAWDTINPINIVKHAFHYIKKYGYDPHAEEIWYKKWPKVLFKTALMAVAVAIVEVLEHAVLPVVMVKLTGIEAFYGLAAVPLLEIVLPIVIAYFGNAKKDVVDAPGHLDWYEENYGEIENTLDDNVFVSRTAFNF